MNLARVILLIEKSRSYGRDLLNGIARYSRLHGPWIFFETPEFYRQDHKSLATWLRSLDAQGIIGHIADPEVMDLALSLRIPSVLCSVTNQSQNQPGIFTDSQAIGRLAADTFLEQGYHSFGFCGFEDLYWSEERCRAFSAQVKKAGFSVSSFAPPCQGQARPEADQGSLAAWITSLPKPVAILACNDDRAREVLTACRVAQIHVPGEVAVLGVDNDDLVCNLSLPRLSSIALNCEKAGFSAAEYLHGLMEGKPRTDTNITISPLYVVTRHSTDILAIEDQQVATAVRFIHQNPRGRIQVNDLADAAGLSRRSLEQRFYRALGVSPHAEIRRVRISQMAQMLVETDLPITHIADLLGFTYVRNAARWFKQQKGMSPSEFRKQHRL